MCYYLTIFLVHGDFLFYQPWQAACRASVDYFLGLTTEEPITKQQTPGTQLKKMDSDKVKLTSVGDFVVTFTA